MRPSFSHRAARAAKGMIRHGFRRMGVDVRRVGSEDRSSAEPPPLLDDPLEVLYHQRGGSWAAFPCPTEACVYFTGLGLEPGGWHPFTATVEEYLRGRSPAYEGSVFERFHESWRPASAAEAFAGFADAPAALRRVPPYLLYALPWISRSFDETLGTVRDWYRADNSDQGHPDFELERDGLPHFGPVSAAKGRLEWRRLVTLADSMARRGYDRREGDVRVVMLCRGDEVRYLNSGGGYHRTAVARALGIETVPAGFNHPWAIDTADVDLWPAVRSGLWTRDEALRYVDHLFDFDSRAWAREQGLVAGDPRVGPGRAADRSARRSGIPPGSLPC